MWRGKEWKHFYFGTKIVQEIQSVQLVIFHTEGNRLNSPKSGNYFSNDNFSFPWVIWKCAVKQNDFFLTSFFHATVRVIMTLLTSEIAVSRGEAPMSISGWREGQAGNSSEKELHSPHLALFWVSSSCSDSTGFCQTGWPHSDLLGSWVATMAQKAGTEANFICCNKQEDWGLQSDNQALLNLL